MSKIYTKKGDKGETSLLGGKRVKKSNLRVKSYGAVDELNSFVGLLVAEVENNIPLNPPSKGGPKNLPLKRVPEGGGVLKKRLEGIQRNLLLTGSHLADKEGKFIKKEELKKLKEETEKLEKEIDKMQKKLPELKNFILPGGTKPASFAHVCRSGARKAERGVVDLKENKIYVDNYVVSYLNRLSDYFFVLARYLNFLEGEEDKIWKK